MSGAASIVTQFGVNMTNREKEVLELIKEDPLISQKECSKILNISRSAVAGHIMNLTSKGYIKGKGYILKEDPYIVVIGGSNMDILGSPDSTYISRDSNPGKVSISAGGVGRNIAENLARMDCSVKLLSIIGNDLYGRQLMADSRSAGIDMNFVQIMDEVDTSTYLSILDDKKDMISAISSMSIMNNFGRGYIDRNNRMISSASLIILDANLPLDTIDYIAGRYSYKDIFIATVSTAKAEKVKELVGKFHTIKPNRMEAETLSGIKIENLKDMKKASQILINKGVKRVFMSLGENGILFTDKNTSLIYENKKVQAVNASGAGDAFSAALAYSYLNELSVQQTLEFASAASILTVLHHQTINPDISVSSIEKVISAEGNKIPTTAS